ncbi:hypothetical protein [Paenibacillus daejeonensis]|uniref:hypothetical protein n=1 Tax=Paenibacillus daejeonensis TaxID=135193 RepID=UPI00035D936A|nr:hypothetical protein [Paenibacillus daejeonensis]
MEANGPDETKEETKGQKSRAERRQAESVPVTAPTPEPAAEPAAVPAKKQLDQLIYTGPNVGRGHLQQYAVFRGGIPAHVAPLIEQHPEIRTLLVPIAELSKTQEKIQVKGTHEHKAYRILEGVTI